MEFRHLGTSGLKVSAISYGNWVTPAQVQHAQATACVRAALDAGITTFDTADTYGNGRAEEMVRSGKALYIGVSEWTPDQLRAGHALARELRIPFISNQSKYNALCRVIEPDVVPTCRELGIGQVCFSPIEQGVLTGKYAPGQPAPAGSRATDADGGAPFITGLLTDDLLTRVGNLAPLAAAEGLSMAQLAVAWVLANDNVASAITGGSRPEQVADNAAAAGKTLSPETLTAIDDALGDSVQRDGSLVGSMSPTRRPT